MVTRRSYDSSRPIRNSRNTTPRSAKSETFLASITVTQRRNGMSSLNEPSASGPRIAPAPRYPSTGLKPKRRTSGTTMPAVPSTTSASV